MPHFASSACIGVQTAKATLTCAAHSANLVAVARAGVSVVEVFQEQVRIKKSVVVDVEEVLFITGWRPGYSPTGVLLVGVC